MIGALGGVVLLCAAGSAFPNDLPEIAVHAPASTMESTPTPGTLAPARLLDLEAPGAPQALDQLLVEQGWATWDAANSLGLAQGLQVRGFTLSNQGSSQLQATRNLLNGHADIAWRFARDPATLEYARLLGGHDATLLGAGSPGGTLMLGTKAPTGQPFTRASLRASDQVGWRGTLDAERQLGPLQIRAVLAGQWHDRTTEGVRDDRHALLLSTRLPLSGGGHLQWDLEKHVNRMPFPFGTAYAGGQFWLDHAYVDTTRARADRQAWRQALYLKKPLGEHLTLSGHWQAAHTQREETLVGFFNVKNATQLNSYLRDIDERYRQRDAGLQLDGHWQAGDWRHDWSLALGTHRERRDFAGPQNIGGFVLDTRHPVYPPDLSAFTLANRYSFEHLSDSGLGAAWRGQVGAWDFRVGVRQSRLRIRGASRPDAELLPTAQANPLTHAFGLGYTLGPAGRVWLARTQSYLPNRGQFADGAWLPASQARQWEAGWAWPAAPTAQPTSVAASAVVPPTIAVTAFDLQRSNLAVPDPQHADAYLLRGTQRSRGVEAHTSFGTGPLRWTISGTWMRPRITQTASPGTPGDYLAGVADRFASLRVQAPVPAALGLPSTQAWLRLTGSSSRPGDARASFRAPGWGVIDAGLQGQWPGQQKLHWGLQITNLTDRRYVRALTGPDNVWQGPERRLQLWIDMAW